MLRIFEFYGGFCRKEKVWTARPSANPFFYVCSKRKKSLVSDITKALLEDVFDSSIYWTVSSFQGESPGEEFHKIAYNTNRDLELGKMRVYFVGIRIQILEPRFCVRSFFTRKKVTK